VNAKLLHNHSQSEHIECLMYSYEERHNEIAQVGWGVQLRAAEIETMWLAGMFVYFDCYGNSIRVLCT